MNVAKVLNLDPDFEIGDNMKPKLAVDSLERSARTRSTIAGADRINLELEVNRGQG